MTSPTTNPDKIATPRTDALLAKSKTLAGELWNADDVSAFLKHARTLERENQQLKAELKSNAVSLSRLTHEILERINNPEKPQVRWQELFDEASMAIQMPLTQSLLNKKQEKE